MHAVNLRRFLLVLMMMLISACVTINVYFPAAAAEQAADKIIDQVWGEQSGRTPPAEEKAPETVTPQEQTQAPITIRIVENMLQLLIPAAQAQANIDISSPAITALNQRMAERHKTLLPHYNSGAIGLTNDALVAVRDASSISLRVRNTVNRTLAEENDDRLALYREIALANNRPEWESQIRGIFARRWIERAEPGWWYMDDQGVWKQK